LVAPLGLLREAHLHTGASELFEQLHPVGLAARETIGRVAEQHLERSLASAVAQPLRRRACERRAREPLVLEHEILNDQQPALSGRLTQPDGLATYYILYSIETEQDKRMEGAPMAGTLADVTDSNFQAEVIESETPVLVDFWAPWCGPCRVVAPVLEEIAAERQDLRVVKLNIDENQQTAAAFDVLSIPTMILFQGGAPVKKVIGAYPKKKIEAQLFE